MEPFRYSNSRMVFDGSYLMVKNLTVGYTFPVKANSFFRGLRIYGSIQNLLTLTKYPGLNPEANVNGSDGLRQGLDYHTYPIARVFSLGLNIKF
jgi:hypothetical protein